MKWFTILLVMMTVFFVIVYLVADAEWMCGEIREGILMSCSGPAV